MEPKAEITQNQWQVIGQYINSLETVNKLGPTVGMIAQNIQQQFNCKIDDKKDTIKK